jgi:predicted ATP-grasp superfamily ATP-dependent carboligase
MSELAQIKQWPEQLDRPVLVLAMEGWIDAGLGGGAAISALLASMSTEIIATFDDDALIDHRARRPVMRIQNGVNTGLTWPEITVRWGTNPSGRSVVALSGPEPDLRWRQFTTEVVALAGQLGVELVVGLGAFPAPVPHTRPVRLAATATTADLAQRVGFLAATIDVPAGIHGSLERGFAEVAIPAVGIWARVPHYVSAMPYPAASAALLDQLAELADLTVDTSGLHQAAAATFNQIEQLIANSEEHTAMVRQLEAQHDQENTEGTPFDLGNLPSGEEIAEELQRFLRGEQQ